MFQVTREKVESGAISQEDFHHIFQGNRNKKSIDIYLKLKKHLIDKKDIFNPKKEGNEKEWAVNLANIFYSFTTNKPRRFGVYQTYAKDEIKELITLYEEDFL